MHSEYHASPLDEADFNRRLDTVIEVYGTARKTERGGVVPPLLSAERLRKQKRTFLKAMADACTVNSAKRS